MMKNTKLTVSYLTIKILLLLVLFCQKYSSCQNALNNSKTNYGLNDEELRAMLLGLNYNSFNKNKNDIIDDENTKNESPLLHNFINEDTFESEKNRKDEKEIEGIKKSKKSQIDTPNINSFNKNKPLIKNEKKNTSLELKNYQSLQKTIESDKINNEDNFFGDVDENKDNSIFSDNYDLDNINAFINRSNINNLNNSNSNRNHDLYNVNNSHEVDISKNRELSDLKDLHHLNEFNKTEQENVISDLTNLSKKTDINDKNITRQINNVNNMNDGNTSNNLNKRNNINDTNDVHNIVNSYEDNRLNKLEYSTNNNNEEGSSNESNLYRKDTNIFKGKNNINNLKNDENIIINTSSINSNNLNKDNINSINEENAMLKNNSNNNDNDKDINNMDSIKRANIDIINNSNDNVNNINKTNNNNLDNNNNANGVNGTNNKLNYDDNKEDNINNVNYKKVGNANNTNDADNVNIFNNNNSINDQNRTFNNLNNNNVNNANNVNNNNLIYNNNNIKDNSNVNNNSLYYNSNNINNESKKLSDNTIDKHKENNNINNNKMDDTNKINRFNSNNNNSNYISNEYLNYLNDNNNVNDIKGSINSNLNNNYMNNVNGKNKFNLNNNNINSNNINNRGKNNNNRNLSNNNINNKNGNLLLNDSKKLNNYLDELSDTNLEKTKSSQKVININNNESSKMKKLENEELNSEINKKPKENIDEIITSKEFKDPKKKKPEHNDRFSMENDIKYNTEDMYYEKMSNSTKSDNSKYILNSENNEKDKLKQENTDKYLKKNDNLSNTLPKGLNFYKIGESDESEGSIKKDNQIKSTYFSEPKHFKTVTDNDKENEDIKMLRLQNSNNYENKLNNEINYNHKVVNLMNNEERYLTNSLNPRRETKYTEQNYKENSIEDTNKELNESKRDILKKINPVKFEEYTNNELDDNSEGEENKILNKTEEIEENLFSEKITLKKGKYDRNEYEYFKLKNNEFKVLGIINKYSPKGGFSISVDCGGYDDFDEIPGISHLLQHAIFYRSQKRNTTLLSELGKYSSEHNCRTSESFTNYYATANSEDIHHLLKLFADNLFYPIFDEEHIENEVKEINNEFISLENNPESCLKIVSEYITDFKYSKFFVYGNYITLCQNVLRNGLNIKKILYEFHRKCYQPKNMSLSILLGKKVGSEDHYNMSDLEDIVSDVFEKIENYNYSDEKNITGKHNRHVESVKKKFNRQKNNYDNTNLIYNDTHNSFIGYNGNENITFIELINKSNYILDSNQKSKYIEILKKEGWADQIYLYWSSKINIDLYKKVEEFGSIKFLQEVFSGFKKDGLHYKLFVENKYAYDFKIVSTFNKYYLNYGVLIKLTNKGKSNLVHLLHICNIFIKEVTNLFDHDSLDKGLNKYILDYYREKALVTDLNFNNNDVNIDLNDLINYSDKILTYSDDPDLILTINKLIEDKDKNDFRNHIKIASLIGSLMKNENLNIINFVDTFTITNQSKIPYTNITYAIGENPYLMDEGEIINNINLKLPEIKVCPSSSFGNTNIFYENFFFCIPYNNRENFEYSENQQMFVSQEDKNILRSNILYNTPCLIKSSYGYNIYFKKGLTNISRVKTDIIFYFSSKNFTFYEAIYTRIHIIILKKKIKMFLSDYTNCSVNINIKYGAGSYSLHMETNSDFFEELFNKLEELMSAKEIPSTDEFNEAYDELNLMVQTNTKIGIENSLKIMYSLFNKYIPTDKEIYDILNSYFFYPSYKTYVQYINSFFHRNYINIFIYGNIIISNVKNNENSFYNNKNNVNNDRNDYNNINNIITDNNNNINAISDNITAEPNNINSSAIENSNNNNNDNNSNTDNNNEYKRKENDYHRTNNKNNSLYLKRRQDMLEAQEKFGEENYNAGSLQISFNASGIEYLVNLCESFIRKVTNNVIKRSESTYYTRKLNNDEDIEINIQNPSQNISNSITVSYMIASETILSDVLINIIADLISSDFVKFIKVKYDDGYIVKVKTFFTPYGLGGLLFVIQSFDKDVEKLQGDICTFVKYLTFQLMNIEIPELVKKLEIMKESYIINNTIFTFNQEYSSILDQLTIGNECFDKKDKIVKIFDELINCPKIILNKINYIFKSSKKAIFKEYKTFNKPNNENEINSNNNLNERCNYSYMKDIKMSNIQLTDNSRLIKRKKLNDKNILNYDLFKMDELYKKENFINLSSFLQVKEKGFFQYLIDYFRSDDKKNLKDGNYLDFKSCDEEMSPNNIHVFQNFTDNIKKIREYFLLKFTADKQIKEKCSIDYEEIRQHCYAHNTNENDKENVLN